MSTTSPSTKSSARVKKCRAIATLREEIQTLEAALENIPAPKKFDAPEYRRLVTLWNKLSDLAGLDALASTERFDSGKVSSKDKTVRSAAVSYQKTGVQDHESPEADRDFVSGGCAVGLISESPELGPRISTPNWVSDPGLFQRFQNLLEEERARKFPSLVAFEEEKTRQDCQLLVQFFLDHFSLKELLHGDDSPAEKDALKKRIRKLVDSGYRLLQISKPTAEEREARRREKQEYEDHLIEKSQYGTGTDPNAEGVL